MGIRKKHKYYEIMLKYKYYVMMFLYLMFYLVMFHFLESRTNVNIHIIHSKIDSYIPFCEYFIIPYFLWFAFIGITAIYFLFVNKSKTECFEFTTNLIIGMTIFLLISLVYPNGHDLRPIYIARNNILTDMVKFLYTMDTPTNIFPSIHVYNSVAAHMAIVNCEALQKRHFIKATSLILTVSIILSTMFLKQHTIVDVLGALILNFISYLIIYRPNFVPAKEAVYTRES